MATDITSLRRPPAGWRWSPARREHQRIARATDQAFHVGESVSGPRADSVPSDGAPTLVAGSGRMPTACTACGGGFVEAEVPLGQHRRGTVTCVTCGTTVAWLAPSLAPIGAHRFGRLDGCGPACSALYGHDPLVHERYGQARAVLLEVPMGGVVATGPLAVDLDRFAATVHGQPIALTKIEFDVLAHLARHVGDVCGHRAIATAVWDASTADVMEWPTGGPWHALRVHVVRLRKRLGTAAPLLETVTARGYRLAAAPVEDEGER